MSDMQNQISRVVTEFTAQITTLAQRAVFETVATVYVERIRRRDPSDADRAAAATLARVGAGKRSPDDLAAVGQMLLRIVTKHPGLRIEQINKRLGMRTKDLALPVRKLLAERMIHTEGRRRSTTYFAGSGVKSFRRDAPPIAMSAVA